MPRNSIKRKYRPCVEAVESKVLLSAGLLTHGRRHSCRPQRLYHSKYSTMASARMAPGRELSSSRPDHLLFLLSRVGFDFFELHLVRRPCGVKLDGPAQFFDRFGVGALTLCRPSLEEMNPALLSQDLAKQAEILGIFRGTLARLFSDQPGKMVKGGLAIALSVRDAGHGEANGGPAARVVTATSSR